MSVFVYDKFLYLCTLVLDIISHISKTTTLLIIVRKFSSILCMYLWVKLITYCMEICLTLYLN